MYSYEWDSTTGGYILIPIPLNFSKEPRPVYYKELDILGFDKYWTYDKNDSFPYMWAEANNYYYRGRLVAKTKGGSIYTAPEIILVEDPEPAGYPLRYVDIPAMVEKNRDIIEQLAQDTIKKVYNVFLEYNRRIDVFYVAFSGGKDSMVTLDIVQRALPHNQFKVLFGDTGMEFPDTYALVSEVQQYCDNNEIVFLRSHSHLNPMDTWKQFGPPSTVTRWCCSVHKTAPQILLLRNLTNKPNFTGMAFVGVRASESISRSEYEYLSIGGKHKGQYSYNPILDWNSAELFAYIYMQNLLVNDAYKKGNCRAGCLMCPNVSEKNAFFRRVCYKGEFDKYLYLIKECYSDKFPREEKMDEFLENTGWKARMNGRDVNINIGCMEKTTANYHVIHVEHPRADWKEWIKTLGVLRNETSPFTIDYHGKLYTFEMKNNDKGYDVYIPSDLIKKDAVFAKYLKNIFYKSASCIGCKECAADCHNGYISMENGTVHIDDRCVHCLQCHKVDKGCLIYKSLQMPKGDNIMKAKSLNCYSTHAPLVEWLDELFEKKEHFFESPSINGPKVGFFSTFLRHANIIDDGKFTRLFYIVDSLTLDNEAAWALMLVNLSYTPEVGWYVQNVGFNENFNRQYIVSKLTEDAGCANERAATDVFRSYCRLLDLGFNQVGMGFVDKSDKKNVELIRTSWKSPDERVILYSLYKFAEACGNYKQFTLTRLLDNTIESDGISPTQIFGLDRDTMEKILNGLTFNYPDYIEARFTLGLDNITLKSDLSSAEILNELF